MTTFSAPRIPIPLSITRAEVEGPTLLVEGEGWSLSVTCLWRWVKGDEKVVSCEAPDAADLVWDLIGDTIVGLDWRGQADIGRDPSVRLASGGALDILSHAPFDTWAMHLPGTTYVGSLAEESG